MCCVLVPLALGDTVLLGVRTASSQFCLLYVLDPRDVAILQSVSQAARWTVHNAPRQWATFHLRVSPYFKLILSVGYTIQ